MDGIDRANLLNFPTYTTEEKITISFIYFYYIMDFENKLPYGGTIVL